jgi:hypothetical protein
MVIISEMRTTVHIFCDKLYEFPFERQHVYNCLFFPFSIFLMIDRRK